MHQYARLSLVSVVLTAAAITVNHLYSLGPQAFVLGAVLIAAPTALLWWFRNTRSQAAFVGYMLVNAWIVVGFGLVKGLWDGILRLFLGTFLSSVSASFPKPMVGSFGFEASGILTFVGSLFILYFACRLIRERHAGANGAASVSLAQRQAALLVGGSLVAAATVLGAYAFADEDRWMAPADGVVRIGVIVPTQGPYAVLGNSFLKAVQMAQDDLPQNTRYRYELVVEDSGPDPKKARDVIEKTVEHRRVDAVLGAVSLIGQVTKPYVTKERIAHLCVCSVTSIGDGAYNFTNIPAPEDEGRLWVTEAQRRGIKTVALMSQEYPSINNHVSALKAEAARVGLQVVFEQKFDGATTDFQSIIAKAQGSTPDIFFIEAFNPALDLLAQQLADANIKNLSSIVAPSVSQRQDLFEGVWYNDSDLVDFGFKKRFEAKYPDTQFATHMMPYAYDDFNMIVEAYEKGQNPAVYIRNIAKYDGVAGPLTKARGSGNFKSTPAIWTIKNGKPLLIK